MNSYNDRNFSSDRYHSRQPYQRRRGNESPPYVSRHPHSRNRSFRRPENEPTPSWHSENRRNEEDQYILSVNESNVKKAAENLLVDRSYLLGMVDKRSPAAYAMESLFNVVEVFRRKCNRLTDQINDLQEIIEKNKSADKIRKPVQPKIPSKRPYPGLTPIQVKPKTESPSESEKESAPSIKNFVNPSFTMPQQNNVVNQQPSFAIPAPRQQNNTEPSFTISRQPTLDIVSNNFHNQNQLSLEVASSSEPIITDVKLPRISPALGMLSFVDESTYKNPVDSSWSSKAKKRIAHQSVRKETVEPKTNITNNNVIQQPTNNLSSPDSPMRDWSEQDISFFRDIIRRLNSTNEQTKRQSIINELREKNLFKDFLQFKSRYQDS